ncbi:MAG: hypothetical protein B7X86_06710 [Sphingobacteriales bacterium 17-39-43]|nr:MAG: hypothetical protein B7Y24_07525 [Sphingobacteriales bacterium 16-39-50]OZA25079.1 MAG: hypothetical protein B7X86_06710 [Sphingobacteriales bacterium 17-39-43]
MMGHDAVPHFHENEHDSPEHSASLPHSTNDGLTDLQNSFTHFQHSTAESNLIYLGSAEKKVDLQKKTFYNTPFISVVDNRPAWYANYKKQHFREYIIISPTHQLKYFSLRGPPSS